MKPGDLLTVPTAIEVFGLLHPLTLPAGSRVRVVGVTTTSLGVLVEVESDGRRVTLPKKVLEREPDTTRGK
jgi:hypothetical protein